MPETPTVPSVTPTPPASRATGSGATHPSTSIRDLWSALLPQRSFVLTVCGVVLGLCLVYCLIAPNQYEASARIALRATPTMALHLDGGDAAAASALAPGQVQLETLARILRGEQLAWKVIVAQSLYQSPGFLGRFGRRFPDFNPNTSNADAQAYFLDWFARRLKVRVFRDR